MIVMMIQIQIQNDWMLPIYTIFNNISNTNSTFKYDEGDDNGTDAGDADDDTDATATDVIVVVIVVMVMIMTMLVVMMMPTTMVIWGWWGLWW